jgi:GNAT superfamily N-acetyltransferase
MFTKIERLSAGDEERLRAIRLQALSDSPDAFGTTFNEASVLSVTDWRR